MFLLKTFDGDVTSIFTGLLGSHLQSLLLFSFQPNLENLRPQLAGDEETVARFFVGDAVEDFRLLAVAFGGEQPRQVDPSGDFAVGRVDADDAV